MRLEFGEGHLGTKRRPSSDSRLPWRSRGAAENHIKSWKTDLAADRTSCPRATANQFRLFLHAEALVWGPRAAMSELAVAQFDTLRLRLIKFAARVVEMKNPKSACSCRHPARTSASCASSSVASPNSRHKRWDADVPKQTRQPQTANPRLPSRRITAGA